MEMPAWYDLYGLLWEAREDDDGIELAKNYVHGLIDKEILEGIRPERIILAGFGMGGSLALYSAMSYEKHRLGAIITLSTSLIQREKLMELKTPNNQLPLYMGHGLKDYLIAYVLGLNSRDILQKINPNVQFHKYQMDHTTSEEVVLIFWETIGKGVPHNGGEGKKPDFF